MQKTTLIKHPLVQHKLTIMRKKATSCHKFRTLLKEISVLLAYEVTRDLPLTDTEIETPLEHMQAPIMEGRNLALISILRAGNGLLEGMHQLIPSARVGHIGLYREPSTLVPVEYYYKMPNDMNQRTAIVVDPMLATGHSAIAAVERLKESAPKEIRFVCLLASPQGLEAFYKEHPEVTIYTAAIDRTINDKGYILPGLGDAGDRIYGTQ